MLAMRNGGGAFLVPYLLALVLVGIPLFVLELCVGQVFQVSASRVWGKFDKRLTGVGWGAALTAFNVAVYYNVIIAWTLYYLVASFRSPLPWTRANSAACMPTSSESFLPASDYWESCVTQHVALSESGWLAPNWPLTVALVTAWVMAWGALHNGIESSGKVVLFTATFPYVVLVILFFRGVTLEGASEGIMYYVTPDFSKLGNMQVRGAERSRAAGCAAHARGLLGCDAQHSGQPVGLMRRAEPAVRRRPHAGPCARAQVWASATTQIFFSLGPGFGTHIGYASYVPKDTKFLRDGLCIGLINSATSVFAGFVVFSVLGHLAHVSGVPVSELALSGPGLAFIAYPTALALLPGAHVFAVLFFLMVISLAIDSQMGQLEVGISAFVERGWRIFQGKRLGQGIAVVCAVGLVIGLSCTTRGGVEMVAIFDGYSCLISVYVTCFCQLFAIIHIHGISGFVSLVRDETGTQLPRWLTAAWTYVTMPLCAVLGTMSVVSAFRRDASSEAPLWTTILGWLIGLSPIVVTVIVGYIAWRNAQRRLQSGVAGSKSKLNGKHLNGGVLL